MRRRANRRRGRQEEAEAVSTPRRLSWFLLGVVSGVFASFFMVIAMTGVGSSIAALGASMTKHAFSQVSSPVAPVELLSLSKEITHIPPVPVEAHMPSPPPPPTKKMVMAPHQPSVASNTSSRGTSGVQMTTVKPATKVAPVDNKKTAAKPKYAFYQILKDEKNTGGARVEATAPAAETTKAVALPMGYYLKVASLRNEKEAEALKAKLMLEGYQALVKQVNVKAVLWSRVMIGPYATIKEASEVQTTLQADNLHAILLKSDQIS